jgi:Flp pilus assembly protein TadG
MIHLVMKSLHQLKRQIAAFSGNVGGLAALEFAIILPLMLVTVFGTVGVTSVITIDRKVTLIARTLSDLTSQSAAVADADIDNFFAIGNAMLTPYAAAQNPASGGPLKAVITEVYVNPTTGTAKVQWSKANEAASAASGDDADMIKSSGQVVEIPTDLIGKDATGKILPNQYFILSDVRYKYAPSILPGVTSWPLKETTYTRPRNTSVYACVLLNGQTACPTT